MVQIGLCSSKRASSGARRLLASGDGECVTDDEDDPDASDSTEQLEPMSDALQG